MWTVAVNGLGVVVVRSSGEIVRTLQRGAGFAEVVGKGTQGFEEGPYDWGESKTVGLCDGKTVFAFH